MVSNVVDVPCYWRTGGQRLRCKPEEAHLLRFAYPGPETRRRARFPDSHDLALLPFLSLLLCNSTDLCTGMRGRKRIKITKIPQPVNDFCKPNKPRISLDTELRKRFCVSLIKWKLKNGINKKKNLPFSYNNCETAVGHRFA